MTFKEVVMNRALMEALGRCRCLLTNGTRQRLVRAGGFPDACPGTYPSVEGSTLGPAHPSVDAVRDLPADEFARYPVLPSKGLCCMRQCVGVRDGDFRQVTREQQLRSKSLGALFKMKRRRTAKHFNERQVASAVQN